MIWNDSVFLHNFHYIRPVWYFDNFLLWGGKGGILYSRGKSWVRMLAKIVQGGMQTLPFKWVYILRYEVVNLSNLNLWHEIVLYSNSCENNLRNLKTYIVDLLLNYPSLTIIKGLRKNVGVFNTSPPPTPESFNFSMFFLTKTLKILNIIIHPYFYGLPCCK